MPRREERAKAKAGTYARNPLVPIDGARVGAVLRWRNYSANEAARVMVALDRDVNGRRRGNAISQQALSNIVTGKQTKCRLETRRLLARLGGPPVTDGFLGGSETLRLPPLLWPPSGTAPIQMPSDGTAAILRGWSEDMPSDWELEALALGTELRSAARQDTVTHDVPTHLENAVRWLLSILLWREFLFEGQSSGQTLAELQEDAALFARHFSSALKVLLGPWIKHKVTLRRRMLRRVVDGLDWIANTNLAIRVALDGGWQGNKPANRVDLAIIDEAGASRELRERLEGFRDAERQRGTADEDILRRIRGDISSDDE